MLNVIDHIKMYMSGRLRDDNGEKVLLASNVKQLDLSKMGLHSLPLDLIESFPNLNTIILKDNNLWQETDLQALDDVNPKLRYIDLSDNNYKGLKNRTSEFRELKVLKLGHNRIEHLSFLNLSSFDYLEELDVSHNELKGFPYLNLYNIKKLNISFCNLNDIDEIKMLSTLEELDASNNHLKELPDINNFRLQHFNLSHNEIVKIKDINFNTEFLDLSHNKIRKLESDNKGFIKHVDLSYNKIIHINDFFSKALFYTTNGKYVEKKIQLAGNPLRYSDFKKEEFDKYKIIIDDSSITDGTKGIDLDKLYKNLERKKAHYKLSRPLSRVKKKMGEIKEKQLIKRQRESLESTIDKKDFGKSDEVYYELS